MQSAIKDFYPSVCSTRVDIVLKRLNRSSRSQRCMIAYGSQFSNAKAVLTKPQFRFRFRFNRIVARRLKITKFTANRKNVKVKHNRQQDNTMQSYSRLQCSPVFWLTAGPVMLITPIQRTYHNRTTKQLSHSLNTGEEKVWHRNGGATPPNIGGIQKSAIFN